MLPIWVQKVGWQAQGDERARGHSRQHVALALPPPTPLACALPHHLRPPGQHLPSILTHTDPAVHASQLSRCVQAYLYGENMASSASPYRGERLRFASRSAPLPPAHCPALLLPLCFS